MQEVDFVCFEGEKMTKMTKIESSLIDDDGKWWVLRTVLVSIAWMGDGCSTFDKNKIEQTDGGVKTRWWVSSWMPK